MGKEEEREREKEREREREREREKGTKRCKRQNDERQTFPEASPFSIVLADVTSNHQIREWIQSILVI